MTVYIAIDENDYVFVLILEILLIFIWILQSACWHDLAHIMLPPLLVHNEKEVAYFEEVTIEHRWDASQQ